MSISIMAWGTGNPNTREYHILQNGERIADITLNQADLQALIAELSEWTDAF